MRTIKTFLKGLNFEVPGLSLFIYQSIWQQNCFRNCANPPHKTFKKKRCLICEGTERASLSFCIALFSVNLPAGSVSSPNLDLLSPIADGSTAAGNWRNSLEIEQRIPKMKWTCSLLQIAIRESWRQFSSWWREDRSGGRGLPTSKFPTHPMWRGNHKLSNKVFHCSS